MPRAKGLTEKVWQAQVTHIARPAGWRVYHTRFSVMSEAGFPDLCLVRPPRVLFVELKTDIGNLTTAQHEWGLLLSQCPGIEYYVWRPAMVESVYLTLLRLGRSWAWR